MHLVAIQVSSLENMQVLFRYSAHFPSLLQAQLPLPPGLSTCCHLFLEGSSLDLPMTDFFSFGSWLPRQP